jgi:two-component sensor histidine kinase
MAEVRRVLLEPDSRSLRATRDVVADVGSTLSADVVDRARIALGELVANSIVHGALRPGDRIEVTLDLDEDRLRCTVADPGRSLRRPADEEWFRRRAGWGFWIVSELVSRWSVAHRRRTEAWFEIDLPSGERGDA